MDDVMPDWAINPSCKCKECGQDMKPSMARLSNFCIPCLERAMDALTTADLKSAMVDLIIRSRTEGEGKT